MSALPKTSLMTAPICFQLNGREVKAEAGESLLTVAQREGLAIPHLCHKDGLTPAGNCRVCVVEVQGERTLAASCCRAPTAGMVVQTESERAVTARRTVLELLLSDIPQPLPGAPSEVHDWGRQAGAHSARFEARSQPQADFSHPAIAVNLDACIQCTRCLRACRDEQVNDVIGLGGRGAATQIVFDQGDALGASTCVGCGECVQACPTGALMPATAVATELKIDKKVDSLCPFCGVGCQVTYQVQGNKVVGVEGRNGPANEGRLCVKGRFGYDYIHHPQRLTKPLIRRDDAPKNPDLMLNADDWRQVFREATWEEALARAADGVRHLKESRGPKSLAGFGSAKGSNEEAYLFQKLVRNGFGSNNVDHCTRLCHASSVAALLEGIGSGAVSNPVRDVGLAEVVLVIGANPTVNHPVAATWVKNAVKDGLKLVVLDPRRNELSRHAHRYLQFTPGSDVALLNAMMHVIIQEGLVDAAFIADRTSGFEDIKSSVADCTPERMAPVCGIDAGSIREVARLYAQSRASMILWGMGISQHTHGTDNARCLIALALMTGQIGRPGTGLHPLRGQNNVQGASDAGLIPMMLPDYQRVTDPAARARFEKAWQLPEGTLDSQPGLTVVEVMQAIERHEVRGMFIMGENPAMSDPDAHHARHALASLEHLVVQDIFLTETAALADVVLPASALLEKDGSFTNTDRLVQRGRAAVEPPGEARQDLWILQALAQRLGLAWDYQHVGEVFDEMCSTMPNLGGMRWQRLEAEGAITYPCTTASDPGQPVIFTETFPRTGGLAQFVAASVLPPAERPDADYPLVLITGRQLEHWHTGSMTRRAGVLDALEPDPVALVHPEDLQRLGIAPGEVITLASRRGQVSLYARADASSPPGAVFVAFCYAEAAINLLTHAALDPVAKIPEFKYCAVNLTRGGTVTTRDPGRELRHQSFLPASVAATE